MELPQGQILGGHMKKQILDNGVRVLYKYREGAHTSFTIGFEAGANSECGYNLGVAHALEHMVFKGTTTRSENEINSELDRFFGFNNAMTNFPYVVYYGTTANDDFEKGFELYSDIILNPSFPEDGFKEEIDVIIQEQRQWKEDLDQHCEDLLLFNGYKNKRFKEIIIGTEESIRKITLEELKRFYKEKYVAKNCVISLVTSLDYSQVISIVEKYFGNLKNNDEYTSLKESLEENSSEMFIENKSVSEGAKIQIAYDIGTLTMEEIIILKLFNLWFGEGVSSLLFHKIRTESGLAYEVGSEVKWEKGIKVFKIYLGTSKDAVNQVLDIIEQCINEVENIEKHLKEEELSVLINRYKLKISLEIERSIVLCNRMNIYELLNNCGELIFKELNFEFDVTLNSMKAVCNKVFKKATIQVLQ
jgi:predicted Zn-dependent peptidase